MLLPSRTVVLEILETVPADAELVRACKRLKQAGFRLALDDFSPYEDKDELVAIADYVKVDFRASGPAERQKIYKMFGKKTIFLAEKVETLAEVRTAQAEGNKLFQGYYHARPEIIAETQITAGKAVYLQLFAALADTPMDTKRVERLLLMEPSLCYRLLRLANSAVYGLRHRISTIQAALNTVGEDAFRKLVTVVLASNLSPRQWTGTRNRHWRSLPLRVSSPDTPRERGRAVYARHALHDGSDVEYPHEATGGPHFVDSRIQEALLGSPKGTGPGVSALRIRRARRGFGRGCRTRMNW